MCRQAGRCWLSARHHRRCKISCEHACLPTVRTAAKTGPISHDKALMLLCGRCVLMKWDERSVDDLRDETCFAEVLCGDERASHLAKHEEKRLDLLIATQVASIFTLSPCGIADKKTSPHLALCGSLVYDSQHGCKACLHGTPNTLLQHGFPV